MGARGGSRKPALGFACGKGAGGEGQGDSSGGGWKCVDTGLRVGWERTRGDKDDPEADSHSNGKEGTPALVAYSGLAVHQKNTSARSTPSAETA